MAEKTSPQIVPLGNDRFAKLCVEQVTVQFNELASTVANGGCKDHDVYCKMTGKLSGYREAIEIIKACAQKMNMADDDVGGELGDLT